MKKLITIIGLAFSLTATAAEQPAQPAAKTIRNFNGQEFNIDAFGVMSRPDLTGAPRWGEGIGVGYYVTRGLGFAASVTSYNDEGVLVDEIQARIVFRAPLWDTAAPYGFVAWFYTPEGEQTGAGAGGGLELRFTRHIAAYGETGVFVSVEGLNDWQTRAGVRFSF